MLGDLYLTDIHSITFYFFVVLLAGIAIGGLIAWAAYRDLHKDDRPPADLQAQWRAMAATQRMADAAWDARQEMYQAAADGRRQP